MKLRQTFLDHLEELRWRLLASLAAIGIVTIVAFFFSNAILEFLIAPLRAFGDYTLYFHSPFEGFATHVKVSLFTGMLAASPVILTELWLFVAPGLHRHERKLARSLVAASILLFLVGAAFAFWVLVPWGLQFFLGFQTDSLRPLLGVGPYLSFLVGMVLASGIVFDLPIVLLGLVKARILSQESLKKARKSVIVAFFILTAILTPTTDPVTQILLALPLILLYESCVFVAGWLERHPKSEVQNLKSKISATKRGGPAAGSGG